MSKCLTNLASVKRDEATEKELAAFAKAISCHHRCKNDPQTPIEK